MKNKDLLTVSANQPGDLECTVLVNGVATPVSHVEAKDGQLLIVAGEAPAPVAAPAAPAPAPARRGRPPKAVEPQPSETIE
jgi:hypothetical protein